MKKDLLTAAFMAAESEINLLVNDLAEQLQNRMIELFQQSDERWIERIGIFSFGDDKETKGDRKLREKQLIAARKAKTLMFLQGMNATSNLKNNTRFNNKRCLGQVIAQLMNSPENEEYFKRIIDNDQLKSDK